MKKILMSIALSVLVFNAQARTHTSVGDGIIEAKKGDTVIVKQPPEEMNFTVIPGVTRTLKNGVLEKGKKVWKFIALRDMKITLKKGQPIGYEY